MIEQAQVTVPSNPEVRRKIKGVIEDIVNQLTLIAGHRATINEQLEALEEETEIPKKVLRRMARVHFNESFRKEEGEFDMFSSMYEALFESNNRPCLPDDGN